jgi:hypothetical protein
VLNVPGFTEVFQNVALESENEEVYYYCIFNTGLFADILVDTPFLGMLRKKKTIVANGDCNHVQEKDSLLGQFVRQCLVFYRKTDFEDLGFLYEMFLQYAKGYVVGEVEEMWVDGHFTGFKRSSHIFLD